ncbi:MAG: hypothetical protein ACJAZF_002134 [Granulosicoccus sp.]|jgi:hypothetical protein
MTLKVIGTGFGRTGTDSMRNALNILGVGPTHHMFELGEDAPLREPWLKLVKGADPDWELLFTGYNACIDWPSAFYWRTLIVEYPDAKVLLTMRSATSWWKSFESTILKLILSEDKPNSFGQLLLIDQVFDGRPDDRAHAIAIYNRNVEEVLATVDPERLLIHNLGDGWEPLCEWLDRPVPDIDYPSGNTTQDFRQRVVR